MKKQISNIKEEFYKKFTFRVWNVSTQAYVVRRKELDKFWSFFESKLKSEIDTAKQQGREDLIEEVKKTFIEEFKGSGESWFPYVGCGDTTEEEELEAVVEAWKEFESKLHSK